MSYPEITSQKCTGCGLCASVCTNNGLKVLGAVVSFINTSGCAGCGLCESVCPTGAISNPFSIVLDEP